MTHSSRFMAALYVTSTIVGCSPPPVTNDAATDAHADASSLDDVAASDDGRDSQTHEDASLDQSAEDASSDSGRDAASVGRRVFVTSALYQGSFANGTRDDAGRALGAVVADANCQQLADAAGLGGRWRAWLSSSQGDAIERVTGSGPWSLVTGEVVFASSLLQLPSHAIDRDERGAMVSAGSAAVWTGTAPNGRAIARDSMFDTYDCYLWGFSGNDRLTGGRVGSALATSTAWTSNTTSACNQMARLYCFEQ
ncbi:MAG: hypothetical protein U0269_02320 [Polyangiales bacterium]